ncbi:MAG: hypothetical protein P8Y97_00760, partial [Candidatus Lokiarchaeota archaeon]
MSVHILLYGDLKNKFNSYTIPPPGSPFKIDLIKSKDITSVRDILNKLRLKEREISHIFVNAKYCGPGEELKEGDRIGIFPKNMGLIFAEIEQNNTISVVIDVSENLKRKFNHSIIKLTVPKGTNVGYLLKKLNLYNEIEELEILINSKK